MPADDVRDTLRTSLSGMIHETQLVLVGDATQRVESAGFGRSTDLGVGPRLLHAGK